MRTALLAALACAAHGAAPNLWPLPKTYTSGTDTLAVDAAGFAFAATQDTSAELDAAFARYKEMYFPRRAAAAAPGAVVSVSVAVKDASTDLQLGVDESYTLAVSADGVKITANTQFGAYHAMETLGQLVVFNAEAKGYEVRGAPWSIDDAPRFAHREVLIDTARHYQPVVSLKRIIQSFTYAKVNTMHWHLVDSQSFPWVAPSSPAIAEGAYSEQERYTHEDIADVVEYARARGVRVVVEIDTPGHAESWCAGHPEICPSATCKTPLRPDINATFDLIEGFVKDIVSIAPDSYYHIGGDEVNTACWGKSPEVSAWMKAQGFDEHAAFQYFVQRVTQIVQAQGRHVVGWDELWANFGTSLDKGTIIHQWRPGSPAVKPAVQAGYKVIWSNDGPWYLDHETENWKTMYNANPCDGLTDDECATGVLGGGGEMWGERIDISDIEGTVWPRMGAIAERLWSQADATASADDAESRYAYFRCYLNQRGVRAAPYNNKAARTNPSGPGSCYAQ